MPDPVSLSRRPLTITQVAKRLGVSHWTVRRMVHAGTVKAFRLPSGYWRVEMSEVERLMQRLPKDAQAA